MIAVQYHRQRGFTLVELLIVVIILAILAAIVVPQFASSTDDAKLSALDSTLSNVRAAIDIYYQQHGEYPGELTPLPASGCASGTKGTDGGATELAFREQLSMYTDSAGGACSIGDSTFKYGPYLKKSTLPANPITGINTLVVVGVGDLNMAGAGTPAGWKYDYVAGKFIANDDDADPNGVKYDAH
ncbi:MAG: prepilin-type N-terminal cleavage/methylation domain-containing protein [Gammaproteobacteria bacterium]|nr:prepilin-type N-terminal cleavage/methylation domain-containing protein [Gammaproteobacteria bacterium]